MTLLWLLSVELECATRSINLPVRICSFLLFAVSMFGLIEFLLKCEAQEVHTAECDMCEIETKMDYVVLDQGCMEIRRKQAHV